MSAVPISRLTTLREAAARVAREKRRRELVPDEEGTLAGRYHGPHRWFDLEWVPEECGYRRRFARDSRWLWEDPTIYSSAEVRALTTAGTWGGSGSAPHVPAKAGESERPGAERSGHQRPRSGPSGTRGQIQRAPAEEGRARW